MSGELVSEKKHVLLVTRRVISDPRKWMRKAAKGVPETNEEWLNGVEWSGVECLRVSVSPELLRLRRLTCFVIYLFFCNTIVIYLKLYGINRKFIK